MRILSQSLKKDFLHKRTFDQIYDATICKVLLRGQLFFPIFDKGRLPITNVSVKFLKEACLKRKNDARQKKIRIC